MEPEARKGEKASLNILLQGGCEYELAKKRRFMVYITLRKILFLI
jgi:hypothetical protein